MGGDIKKIEAKNHKLGLWAFLLSLTPIVWLIILFIKDFILLALDYANFERNTYITMAVFLLINTLGITIGIIALFKKGYKKTLAIWGITINSLFPIWFIITFISLE